MELNQLPRAMSGIQCGLRRSQSGAVKYIASSEQLEMMGSDVLGREIAVMNQTL